ncbi:DUF742 domain-containing protein [Nocardia sp. alder85J]|uniref:DUF742 domain-containing protein n=1 Tax=Nocardia sp. alder85J TaxID=2862949 RepID=UPI001CD30128|nr:DUF742 domain-containing protein [Nocardia sp. alder85J]MCX4095563.1 DUF742 domain-containing protein [Nocardia sp. alder85J]
MSHRADDPWSPGYEDDPGPLVRPFAVTRGRTAAGPRDLDILTRVSAAGVRTGGDALEREYREILRLCDHTTLSIAEIAAHLHLFVAAAKVLVADLIDGGYLIFRAPPTPESAADPTLLRAVLEGIRRL